MAMTHLNNKTKTSLIFMLVIMLMLSNWCCKSSKSFDLIEGGTPRKLIDRFVLTYKNSKTNSRLYIPVRKEYSGRTTHIKTHSFPAQGKDGHILKEFFYWNADSAYRINSFQFISGNPMVYIDSVMRRCYSAYGETIAPDGLKLNTSVGYVRCPEFISGCYVLSEKGDWKGKGVFYIFSQVDDNREFTRRTMYVHNIGFIWEEIYFQGKVHRWELVEIDGMPLMEYLDTHPDFSFFEK